MGNSPLKFDCNMLICGYEHFRKRSDIYQEDRIPTYQQTQQHITFQDYINETQKTLQTEFQETISGNSVKKNTVIQTDDLYLHNVSIFYYMYKFDTNQEKIRQEKLQQQNDVQNENPLSITENVESKINIWSLKRLDTELYEQSIEILLKQVIFDFTIYVFDMTKPQDVEYSIQNFVYLMCQEEIKSTVVGIFIFMDPLILKQFNNQQQNILNKLKIDTMDPSIIKHISIIDICDIQSKKIDPIDDFKLMCDKIMANHIQKLKIKH